MTRNNIRSNIIYINNKLKNKDMPFGSPVITEDYIICEECGKFMKKITSSHLKLHKLTIPEYKEKWGLYHSQPLEAFYIKKIRQEAVERSGAKENLDGVSFRFKKGETHNRKMSEQEKIRLRAMCVNVQHTDKFKKTISEAAKKVWQREGYKEKYIKNYKKKRDTGSKEYSEKMKSQSKEYWSKKESREEASKRSKKIWNTPEKKKYASERSKKYWANKKLNK